MPETYGLPEPEEDRAEKAERIVREVIAGDQRGAVRRIVLYCLLAGFILLSLAIDGKGGIVFGGCAIIVLLLLGFTDQLA